MKHGVLTATLGALMFALTAQAVTVDGHVFLSGQTDHTGTRIVFAAVSPSARTDSTISVSSGHYQITLQAGVYDVEFSNDGFAAFALEDQLLLFDATLDTQELMPPLSGNLSGILGPGDFDVVDTIRVAAGDSLTIAAGTRFYFRYQIPFRVNGQLIAQGTEQDSILFTRRTNRWMGIRLLNAVGRFEYCIIERANPGDNLFNYSNAGGISSVSSNSKLSRCTIRDNTSYVPAGGIYAGGGMLTLDACYFTGNVEGFYGFGGSVYASADSIAITNCVFDSNSSGIMLGGVHTHVMGCTFVRTDQAIWADRGIIEHCLVRGLLSAYYAIECTRSTVIRYCTIQGSVIFSSGSPTISNSIIASCGGYYPGLTFDNADSARVEYCCAYGNAGGNFSGNTPPGIGIVALTNANGDSCDTYYNIFLDPQFVDVDAGDYHLTAGSPCIDAGDPDLPYDPDGTVADIGVFYFDQLGVQERGHSKLCSYGLSQNYPNPFNARTRITFDLAQAGEVSLNVFDITGRLVRTLADGRMAAGTHEVSLDARDLPSGVYVYRLAAGEVIEAKKMVIIK